MPLSYKPEGSKFETQLVERTSSIYILLPAALGPVVHSATNRNEYQKQKNNVSGSRAGQVLSADSLTL
jgi:hypothetical protein